MAEEHHDNHGQTPAAWTTVIIIMAAAIIATVGVVMAIWPMFYVGIGLAVVGAIVGKVMAMSGMGKQPAAPAGS